jgi:uncharacterized surface protein with fasciclin (FAS1) repeats
MGPGPFTLFAPDDDAFGDAVKSLGATKMTLREFKQFRGSQNAGVGLRHATLSPLDAASEAPALPLLLQRNPPPPFHAVTLDTLPAIIKNHVVAGSVSSKDLTEGMEATTLGGGKIKFSVAGGPKVRAEGGGPP